MAVIVLIPAYEPDNRLPELIDQLTRAAQPLSIVVVDDGSGPEYANVFSIARFLGAAVLTLPQNLGKGAALKAGFAYIANQIPGFDVVCADSDGQHRVADILKIANAVADHQAMVLGARHFTGAVPAKSRIGNVMTKALFRVATGRSVTDTQTGLRAYPASMLQWLQSVPGNRFEYELNLLLRASREGLVIHEEEIETVYLDGNASTHFRPVVDSARIYKPLFAFMASSFSSFLIDFAALFALNALTGNLLLSVVGARLISASCNFVINRRVVFGRTTDARRAAVRYAALATALLSANYALMAALTAAGLPLLMAKLLTEVALIAVSYEVQRRVVFKHTSDDFQSDVPVSPVHGKLAA